MKLSTLRQYWSVWIQVQVECFSTPQLFEQYLRLGGPDVQAIFKPRAPIEQMIDGATGYDKVRKEEQRKVMDQYRHWCWRHIFVPFMHTAKPEYFKGLP